MPIYFLYEALLCGGYANYIRQYQLTTPSIGHFVTFLLHQSFQNGLTFIPSQYEAVTSMVFIEFRTKEEYINLNLSLF